MNTFIKKTGTVKLFWEDPYLSENTATVTSAEGDTVTLDCTVAYPFSGGQASDTGTIGGIKIAEARKEGMDIIYSLPGNTLKEGDRVRVIIDWGKRYRIMRLHFAAELVLELINQYYGHPDKAGANINEDKARLDFEWEGNIQEILPGIGEKIKKMVEADLPVKSSFDDLENEERSWEIDGFAKVRCCGTHIKSTGEIGNVMLKRKNPGKGMERIEIYLA